MPPEHIKVPASPVEPMPQGHRARALQRPLRRKHPVRMPAHLTMHASSLAPWCEVIMYVALTYKHCSGISAYYGHWPHRTHEHCSSASQRMRIYPLADQTYKRCCKCHRSEQRLYRFRLFGPSAQIILCGKLALRGLPAEYRSRIEKRERGG